MKNLLITFFLLSFSLVSGQYNKMIFEYDSEGNQTQRYICFGGGCADKKPNDSITAGNAIVDSEMIKDLLYTEISYYPNPVKEELYIKWINDETSYVSNIAVYSLSGQLILQFSNLKDHNMATVPFLNYPNGYYNVILIYNNGKKKTLKVVKK